MGEVNQGCVVVMTGATSGIGAVALERLVAQPSTEVIVGARASRSVAGATVLPLDLASLESTRSFAAAVRERLGDVAINMLALNAGAQFRKPQRSADGFEMTFAVNHLSHYMLARLLLPNMAEGGRLVITTSDTHDPSKMPLAPRTLDPEALAHATKGSGARAYAASKLCNLLTARSFAALDEVQQRHISVVAYNPGLTGRTSLGGQPVLGGLLAAAARPVLRLMSLFLPQLYSATPEQSGEALADLVLGRITLPPGRVYASHVRGNVTFPDPSKLAQSDDARDLLWRESAAMVGLPA
ncbi:MAG TPA: SDR family NAD(P)-dependent oxidoreductase [Acidimicrobiales bacterium]|nr:SDR family NAD(P)-dependent oxidoreductase [Acidimicrobiales bacterium]